MKIRAFSKLHQLKCYFLHFHQKIFELVLYLKILLDHRKIETETSKYNLKLSF